MNDPRHDIRPGDQVKDNDYRTTAKVGTVIHVNSSFVEIDKGGRLVRVRLNRVWSDGKERSGGYSLIDTHGRPTSRLEQGTGQ